MEIKINITKMKMIWIILAIVLVGFVIAEGELVNQFTNEEEVAINKVIEKELRIKNPTNVTQEDLNLIKEYYNLKEEVNVKFYPFTEFCDGVNNCCKTLTGGHCHYTVVSNFKDNYTIMRDYDGETQESMIEGLYKRVIDKETRKINNKQDMFYWVGSK